MVFFMQQFLYFGFLLLADINILIFLNLKYDAVWNMLLNDFL